MAAHSAFSMEQGDLVQQRRRTNIENRNRSWQQLKDEFQNIGRIIHTDVSMLADFNEQQKTRNCIFEHQNKFVDLTARCSEIRRAKGVLLDACHTLSTLEQLQKQSLTEFLESIQISNCEQICYDAGVREVADFAEVDIEKVFKPQMKTAPFKRLEQKLKSIKNARTFVEVKFDRETQDAARTIKTNLLKINADLSVSFNALTRLSADMRQMSRTRHLKVLDGFGFVAVLLSGAVAYAYRDHLIAPFIFCATLLVFHKQSLNVGKWLASAIAEGGETPQPAVQHTETHQVSIIIKLWTDGLSAELAHVMEALSTLKKTTISAREERSSDLGRQIQNTESEIKGLVAVDDLESELRNLCH